MLQIPAFAESVGGRLGIDGRIPIDPNLDDLYTGPETATLTSFQMTLTCGRDCPARVANAPVLMSKNSMEAEVN